MFFRNLNLRPIKEIPINRRDVSQRASCRGVPGGRQQWWVGSNVSNCYPALCPLSTQVPLMYQPSDLFRRGEGGSEAGRSWGGVEVARVNTEWHKSKKKRLEERCFTSWLCSFVNSQPHCCSVDTQPVHTPPFGPWWRKQNIVCKLESNHKNCPTIMDVSFCL